VVDVGRKKKKKNKTKKARRGPGASNSTWGERAIVGTPGRSCSYPRVAISHPLRLNSSLLEVVGLFLVFVIIKKNGPAGPIFPIR